MLFNSFEFFCFFPLVTVLYFLIPHRVRWVLLLLASYYFYMAWKPVYILLIIASTLIDYFVAQRMEASENQSSRKKWLWLSLASNLGILLTFKYYGFFAANLDSLLETAGIAYKLPISELILPMGISFYTFQTMAYSIDVYNKKIPAERHLGYFALYVSYFPQLVAGPIERAGNLLHQFRERFEIVYSRIASGLKQMLWGFFKKIVIADNIGLLVDAAYADVGSHGGATLFFATFLFAFQIYCDFSGYSDIAIGASRVLGIRLMENFRVPYLSRSISEFWSRWHISLSTWFRDYLYIPLGGNRVVKWRWYYNLMLVFLVSGFWHGANWTFIIWGFLHGLYLVSANVWAQYVPRLITKEMPSMVKHLSKAAHILSTFILVLIAWVFFRSVDISEAIHVFDTMMTDSWDWPELRHFLGEFSFGKAAAMISILVLFILTDPYMDRVAKGEVQLPRPVSIVLFSLLLALILVAGNFGSVDFIYFQF